MKNCLYTILLILLTSQVFSQKISDLDSKNGFKDLKLGSSKSSFGANIKADEFGRFKYTGSCCSTAFDYQVESIFLRFDKEDKLSMIAINLVKLSLSEVVQNDKIMPKEKIISAFGQPTKSIAKDKDGTWLDYWTGKKVELALQISWFDFGKYFIQINISKPIGDKTDF